jgi:hypothetical protein
MKTLKISDDVHQKLTTLLGELVAQTSKMQTYQDAIEAMLSRSVILPPELLSEVESFIEKNKQLGYTTREEFIRDATRFRLRFLSEEYEYIEIPKKQYILLSKAVSEMQLPAASAKGFIEGVIEDVLKKYRLWLEKFNKEPEITEEDEIMYG